MANLPVDDPLGRKLISTFAVKVLIE